MFRLLTIIFFSLPLLFTGCSQSDLFSNLTEGDANHLVLVLQQAGVDARKQNVADDFYKVTVPASRMAQAMAIAKEFNYPRTELDTMKNLYGQKGMITTMKEENIRYLYGTAQSLADTIMSIDGVTDAKVHIALVDPKILGRRRDLDSPNQTASVFVKHLRGTALKDAEDKIKMLVAPAVAGLEPEDVAVIFFESDSHHHYAPIADNSL